MKWKLSHTCLTGRGSCGGAAAGGRCFVNVERTWSEHGALVLWCASWRCGDSSHGCGVAVCPEPKAAAPVRVTRRPATRRCPLLCAAGRSCPQLSPAVPGGHPQRPCLPCLPCLQCPPPDHPPHAGAVHSARVGRRAAADALTAVYESYAARRGVAHRSAAGHGVDRPGASDRSCAARADITLY